MVEKKHHLAPSSLVVLVVLGLPLPPLLSMVAYVVVYTLFEGYDPQYEDTPYDKPDKSFEVLGVYLSLTEANAAAKQEFVDHLNGGEEQEDEDDEDLDRNGFECDTEDVGGGKLKYTALSIDENEKFEIEVTSKSFDDQASPSPSPSPSPPPHGKGGRKKRTKEPSCSPDPDPSSDNSDCVVIAGPSIPKKRKI